MKARIRIRDHWFVAVGAWTPNAEHAIVLTSNTALFAALKWIINELDHGAGAARNELEVIFN